jgi:hypothetical protein
MGWLRRITPDAEKALLALLCVFALVLGYFLDTVGPRTLFFAAVPVLGLLLLGLSYSWAVRLLFVFLCFEGMAKLMTNYNPMVHVGADILILTLTARWFLVFLLRRQSLPALRPPLMPLFAAHFCWFAIQFANPYSLGLIPSLAATKLYVTMLFLYWFGFYLATSAAEVRKFMAVWVLICTIQAVTSLYQARVGPASVLSLSPLYAAALDKFGTFAFRPFGTTNQPGGPSVPIFLAMPIVVFFLVRSRTWLARAFLIALIPAAIAALAFCQVRSAILKTMIGVSGFLVLGFRHAAPQTRKRILALVPVAAAALFVALPAITGSWVSEREENQAAINRSLSLFDIDTAKRARSGAAERITTFAAQVPLGAGLSRTGAAAGKFWDLIVADPYFPQGFFADNFWAAVIAEMGIPGAAILTALLFGVLIRGLRSLRRMRDPELTAQGAVIVASLGMIVAGLWGAEGVLYNPEASFFWFFSGVLMRLPTLEPAPSLEPGEEVPIVPNKAHVPLRHPHPAPAE